ncbi:MAG: polymer-forming cytoskeletal protein [Parvibaculaceae bacterium]|nr:polymer-forming cytoskeletal protein [Parvibaculaceae bacterium]
MFSRKDKKESGPASPATANAGASAIRRSGQKSPPSLIASDVVASGNIVSEGMIQIDGTFDGSVRAAVISIGEAATVKGMMVADEISVRGRVTGNIFARRVQLHAQAVFEGGLTHSELGIELGARFEGSIHHTSEPQEKASWGEEAPSPGEIEPALGKPVLVQPQLVPLDLAERDQDAAAE